MYESVKVICVDFTVIYCVTFSCSCSEVPLYRMEGGVTVCQYLVNCENELRPLTLRKLDVRPQLFE